MIIKQADIILHMINQIIRKDSDIKDGSPDYDIKRVYSYYKLLLIKLIEDLIKLKYHPYKFVNIGGSGIIICVARHKDIEENVFDLKINENDQKELEKEIIKKLKGSLKNECNGNINKKLQSLGSDLSNERIIEEYVKELKDIKESKLNLQEEPKNNFIKSNIDALYAEQYIDVTNQNKYIRKVVKLNRLSFKKKSNEEDLHKSKLETIENEIDKCSLLNNKCLLPILGHSRIEIKRGEFESIDEDKLFKYYTTDYIENATDLRKALFKKLIESRLENKVALQEVTFWLVNKLNDISQTIKHIHANSIIHFDIKPENILIDKFDQPFLNDFGLARDIKNDGEYKFLGFSPLYAHPDLYNAANEDPQEPFSINLWMATRAEREKRGLTPVLILKEYDLYAFGKTILELLAYIYIAYPLDVIKDKYFNYLHLLACRMLDGRNNELNVHAEFKGESQSNKWEIKKEEIDCSDTKKNDFYFKQIVFNAKCKSRVSEEDVYKDITKYLENSNKYFFYQEYMSINKKCFNIIKYDKIENIVEDFKKICEADYLYNKISEIRPFTEKVIPISQSGPASKTKRIEKIIDHPAFKRLENMYQLGLTKTFLPSATHTRKAHSIGVYRNTCLVIDRLFNDDKNPLFKQIFSIDDLECLMLGGLFHDLGHYPFAHEIQEAMHLYNEEIYKGIKHDSLIKHVSETIFEKTNTDKDLNLSSLVKELFNPDVNIERIQKLITFRENTPEIYDINEFKDNILSSILDSSIDVNRMDYLNRDSEQSINHFGKIVQSNDIIRYLTLCPECSPKDIKDSTNLYYTIGVHHKGQCAAESVSFSKYLMYKTIYWHHTARAIAVMVRRIIQLFCESLNDPHTHCISEDKKIIFINSFKDMIFKKVNYYQDIREVIKELFKVLNIKDDDIIQVEIDALFNGILNRKYYKRIATFHDDTEPDNEAIFDYFNNDGNKRMLTERKGKRIRIIEEQLAIKIKERVTQLHSEYESELDHLDNKYNNKEKKNDAISLKEQVNNYIISEINNSSTFLNSVVSLKNKLDSKPKIIKFLIDIPSITFERPEHKEALRLVPVENIYCRDYHSKLKTYQNISEIWDSKINNKLKDISKKIRLYCHPDIRDDVMNIFDHIALRKLIVEIIKEHSPRKPRILSSFCMITKPPKKRGALFVSKISAFNIRRIRRTFQRSRTATCKGQSGLYA